MRILVPLLLVLWALLAAVALAEEPPPCTYVDGKSKVLCTFDGFKKLTTAVVNAEGEAKECRIRLTAAEQGRLEATRALQACVSFVPKAPEPRSMLKPRLALSLAVLGATASTTAAFSSSDPLPRASVGVGGLLSIAAAYWMLSE